MEARAVVATEPGRVAFQTVRVPEPGPDDVVVRVTHSWISNGTEGSFVRGERIAGDTPRGAGDPLPFPHVPGYQKVGVVEGVGGAVTDLHTGDVVFATVSGVEEMFWASGGHVSPAVTRRSQVWKLPPGLDPVAASGLVLTQVGYNVGQCAPLRPGDAAVVLGDGMVGHWAAQTLRQPRRARAAGRAARRPPGPVRRGRRGPGRQRAPRRPARRGARLGRRGRRPDCRRHRGIARSGGSPVPDPAPPRPDRVGRVLRSPRPD
jgi:2-desacetyl-2-hydroxyethyl bacteriochlorophyllide A dehydrogenase